jgi:isopenicillin N synthase-like dioxygenase
MDLRVRYTAPDAPASFTESIRETGFAVLVDHPIPWELVARTYDDWSAFFASDEKHRYTYREDSYWGYYPFLSENAKDQTVKDLKEFFHVYSWSPIPDGMSSATTELFARLDALAGTLLGWIEDNTPEAVRSAFSMPLREMIEESRRTVFRILHYPPLTGDETEGAVRSSAHEDINLITLLPAGTAPGLEVRDTAGTWHEVACDPSSIIVNSGDMLQMASGGYYRSTTHRVVNPTGEAARTPRFSMPLFLHPRPEVRLSEAHTARTYLDERLAEIGLKAQRD